MVWLRMSLAIAVAAMAVACSATALAAGAVAPLSAGVLAHPEPGDVDGDKVLDVNDNCLNVPNGAQVNSDLDAEGDACDADDDNDGVLDGADNCRVVVNPDQANLLTPGDSRGDACPASDVDTDGVDADSDNCIAVSNPDQLDSDGDDKGDACDRDDDNDLYDDGFDNCPLVFNPDQADRDGDKVGSACDAAELIAGAATGPGAEGSGAPGAAAPGAAPGTTPGAAPGAATDRNAPKLTVTVSRRQRLADSGRSLVVRVSCSEACSLSAVVAADSRAARRARLGSTRVVLARGSWSLAGAGRTYVFARWTPTARRLRSGRRLMAALRLEATDEAGNRRTVTRRIELRR